MAVVGLAVVALMATGASSCQTGTGSSGSTAKTVEFIVRGSAPAGVDITYGDDSSNYQGHLPMFVTKKVDSNAMYYDVSAQLNGGGNVTCEVRIGSAKKVGHASGGYNICSAQLNSDFSGGFSP